MRIRASARRALVAAVLVALAPLAHPGTSQAVTTPAPSTAAYAPNTVGAYTGCPTSVPSGTLRDGSSDLGAAALCRQAVAKAPTPQAALAIQAAFHFLGAPYACGGTGRMNPFRFDCSSLVSRAYYLGAGLDTAGQDWAPSTRDMVPWDGVRLASWAKYVDPAAIRPGDLVLYDTGGSTYRHVVMYIGNGYMLHTNSCGDVAHVSQFWGTPASGPRHFLVARRVAAPAGWTPPSGGTPTPTPLPPAPAPTPAFPGTSLAMGSSGAAVGAVQKSLEKKGYLRPGMFGAIKVGFFGGQTRDAVAAFQAARPALASAPAGVVDARTYSAITGWVNLGTTAVNGNEPRRPTVSAAKVAARDGASVRVVQAALNRLIGAKLRVDGQWGPATQAAFNVVRRHILRSTVWTGPPTRASLAGLGRLTGMRVVA